MRNNELSRGYLTSSSSSSSSSPLSDDQAAKQYDAKLRLAHQIRAALAKTDEGSSAQMDLKGRLKTTDYPSALLPSGGGIGDGGGQPIYRRPDSTDDTLALLLPLLVLLSTLIFLLLIFIILVIFVRRRARIALTEGDGPLDVGREEELEGHGGLDGVEERWLENVDEPTRRGYARAKEWSLSSPPGSMSTDITLSQFLSIQEKGVSAWSFDPDYESNPSVYVEARTEITFLADGQGMAPEEGGGCCVQSNLPLPKLNEVYYWEVKMFTKPDTTNVAVGLATKPYPSFRLPGWSKHSVGYFSSDGFKSHNYPFAAQSYGPAYVQGDVIGVGYRPRSGTVFFTRNGKKLEDAFIGLNRHNLFPTIGTDGAAELHVNLGQAGFVSIEANVKKWGLAPMVGTLAPPPAYGMERGSILIETGQGTSNDQERGAAPRLARIAPPPRRPVARDVTPPPPLTPPGERSSPSGAERRLLNASASTSGAGEQSTSARDSLSRRSRQRRLAHRDASGAAPSSSSPPRLTLNAASPASASPRRRGSFDSDESPHNPPTPHHLDISLHSLPGSPHEEDGNTGTTSNEARSGAGSLGRSSRTSYFPQMNGASQSAPSTVRGTNNLQIDRRILQRTNSPSPPPYSPPIGPGNGSLGGTESMGNQARRSSGRTHQLANALFGALTDRGLLTPLSAHENDAPARSNSELQSAVPGAEDPVGEYERMAGLDAATRSNTRGNASSSTDSWFSSWFR